MNKKSLRPSSSSRLAGFTLIELAVGMIIVGFVLSGALLISGKLWDSERRDANREQLQETKAALLAYARKNGHFPMMDRANSVLATDYGDGWADEQPGASYTQWFGWLPSHDHYHELNLKGTDALSQPIQYFVNWQLAKEDPKPCQALNFFYEGRIIKKSPLIYYYNSQANWDDPGPMYNFMEVHWYPLLSFRNDPTNYALPVAAVLVSAGQDKLFNSTNAIASQLAGTANIFDTVGAPNAYFDDIVVYITLSEAYTALNCQ